MVNNVERVAIKSAYSNTKDKQKSIRCGLNELGDITLERIENYRDERYKIWNAMVKKYHYIGHVRLYGGQIRYLIRSEKYGWIGALAYSSGAWQLASRDKWIGWNQENRTRNLKRIICNSRFLIVPYLQVNNLASHILSIGIEQITKDWEKVYGIEPAVIETFVEKGRFAGTSYKAANFEYIGKTQGRGRNDRGHEKKLAIKDIYVYPLRANSCEELCPGQILDNSAEQESGDWAIEEFEKASFEDKRLNKRLFMIARDFYGKPQANISQASESRAKTKAAYRFFDNKAVTMDKILSAHYESTVSRMRKEKIVLAVQDTTSLNYTAHPLTEDIGPIGSVKDGAIGLELHNTMAFNIEGTPLGLLNVQCWARDEEEFGKKHERSKLPIEEKESYRWLESFKTTIELQKQNPKTVIVNICDREADIYELFELATRDEKNPKLLVRANYNRNVEGEQKKLWEHMSTIEISGIQEIDIPRKKNIPGRKADLTIRFSEVELKAPYRRGEGKRRNIKIWAILAREENAPETIVPVEWMLLTTIPINTFEEALEKVDWYTKRWGIEIYHRTLKSGCKIERRQLGKASRIESCLAIDMVIAWRIYHLTKLGREVPDIPCTVFFEEAEWKALVAYKTKNPIVPLKPPTLREAVRMIASLGGFLGRKSDGEPGTQTLWLGLQRLDDITDTWKIFNDNALSPPSLP